MSKSPQQWQLQLPSRIFSNTIIKDLLSPVPQNGLYPTGCFFNRHQNVPSVAVSVDKVMFQEHGIVRPCSDVGHDSVELVWVVVVVGYRPSVDELLDEDLVC